MSTRDLTIIVGKNNSGKSTIIEVLRMISMATKKCSKTTYINAPKSLGLPLTVKEFRLSVEKLKIDLWGMVYCYKFILRRRMLRCIKVFISTSK